MTVFSPTPDIGRGGESQTTLQNRQGVRDPPDCKHWLGGLVASAAVHREVKRSTVDPILGECHVTSERSAATRGVLSHNTFKATDWFG